MKITSHLVRQFGNPLEWSSAAKASMLTSLTAVLHVQYLLWVLYVLREPDYWPYLNIPFLRLQLPWFHFFTATSAVLTVLPLLGRRLWSDSKLYEHLAAQYYGLSLCYYSYLIGTMSMATGAVLAAAPVVGFIFFDRAAVVLAFLSALVFNVLATYASAAGLLLYAPVVVPLNPDGQISMFWANSTFLFTTPHLLSLLAVAAYVLRRWRHREEEVRRLSMTDSLTGLATRGHIVATLEDKLAHARRHGQPVAVIMLDLDHFKEINDSQGHLAGDRALRAAGAVLAATVRLQDSVGRYGGEEFLIVLPDTGTEVAQSVAERCRQALARELIDGGDRQDLHITGSFGVCSNEGRAGWDADELLRHADDALYRAKAGGRNRVCRWPELPMPTGTLSGHP